MYVILLNACYSVTNACYSAKLVYVIIWNNLILMSYGLVLNLYTNEKKVSFNVQASVCLH